MADIPLPLSNPDFDRLTERRADADWLERQRRAENSRLLLFGESGPLLDTGSASPRLLRQPARELAIPAEHPLVLLGRQHDAILFAAHAPETVSGTPTGLREAALHLPADEAALAAYGHAMLHWHTMHRHCGRCGAPTRSREAGHRRECPACGRMLFPRTDPAIIVRVTSAEDAILLGRQANWEPGRYSVIAGFLEPGESAEEGVAREVFEETGVRVTDVRYRHSQPWPFPGTLMLGFSARAIDHAITLHDGELETARFFSRDELLALVAEEKILLPWRLSISRYLIDEWLT